MVRKSSHLLTTRCRTTFVKASARMRLSVLRLIFVLSYNWSCLQDGASLMRLSRILKKILTISIGWILPLTSSRPCICLIVPRHPYRKQSEGHLVEMLNFLQAYINVVQYQYPHMVAYCVGQWRHCHMSRVYTINKGKGCTLISTWVDSLLPHWRGQWI